MGEKPCMATHGGTYEYLLKDEGIMFHHIEPKISHERSLEYVAANRGERGLLGLGFYKDNEELRRHVQHEIKFFTDNTIDIVLTGWTLSNALSTRAAGIPLAVTHLGSYVPPVLGKMGFFTSSELESKLFRIIRESTLNDFYNWAIRFPVFVKPFNVIAKELKIGTFKGLLDLWMGDVTLVTDAPEILGMPAEELENWVPKNPRVYSRKPTLKYVGAIYAELFGELTEDVKTFLDTDKPKVYVALTSSRPDYVLAVYSLVKSLDVKAVLVSTVHHNKLEEGPNILIKKYLPSHKVMPLVDLAVIHGGQGSTQTAIASGTPMIGFPLHGEQRLNLKIIERHGAGICLSLKAIKKPVFRSAIDKVLTDGRYKANMKHLQSLQERYNGAENTAKILKKHISNVKGKKLHQGATQKVKSV